VKTRPVITREKGLFQHCFIDIVNILEWAAWNNLASKVSDCGVSIPAGIGVLLLTTTSVLAPGTRALSPNIKLPEHETVYLPVCRAFV
jgi:hypothetical protein